MSLNVNAILTVAALKTYLGIGTSESKYDDDCESCINYISTAFENYLGIKIKAQDVTEYYDGEGDDTLHLRAGYVGETVSSVFVYIDLDREFGADTLVPHADIYVDSRLGRLVYQYGTFTEGDGDIKVVYRSGWETVPDDLAWAAKEAIKLARNRRDQNLVGVTSVSKPTGGSISYSDGDWPQSVKLILDMYRR